MIDIHSHFLPGIDDGADSEECAIQMLEDLKQQGVNTVVSTSHYYAHNGSIDKFLQDRENSYSQLMHRLDGSREMYPDIILGAEVALTPELSKNEDLGKLCIGDSNAILIELPYIL